MGFDLSSWDPDLIKGVLVQLFSIFFRNCSTRVSVYVFWSIVCHIPTSLQCPKSTVSVRINLKFIRNLFLHGLVYRLPTHDYIYNGKRRNRKPCKILLRFFLHRRGFNKLNNWVKLYQWVCLGADIIGIRCHDYVSY